MLTFYFWFQRACRWMKKAAGRISRKPVLRSLAVAAVLAVFTFVIPGAGAEIAAEETNQTYRQEAFRLAGTLLTENVEKRQETEKLLKIQTEERVLKLQKLEEEIAEKGPGIALAERKAQEEETREKNVQETAVRTDISEQDYQVLLKIVEAEAGICDEKGRILVANVILNRVKSGQFPNTVTSVVYQPSQFSPVSTGFIDRVQVTEKTKESVDRALAGEDYSQGALFFMNRGKSKKKAVTWFDSKLTYLFEHGGHEFFK